MNGTESGMLSGLFNYATLGTAAVFCLSHVAMMYGLHFSGFESSVKDVLGMGGGALPESLEV